LCPDPLAAINFAMDPDRSPSTPTSNPAPLLARCFVALPLDPAIQSALAQAREQWRRHLSGPAIRWVPPGQLHLTLRFFGNVLVSDLPAIAAAVESATRNCPPFQLELDRSGCFPNHRQPRVIWIGLSGEIDRLAHVQQTIAEHTRAWGDSTENRTFHPHLTVGRIKDFRPPPLGRWLESLAQCRVPEPKSWSADQILLIESRLSPAGPDHITRAVISLSPP